VNLDACLIVICMQRAHHDPTSLAGFLFFAVFLGLITEDIKGQISQLREGTTPVAQAGHTVRRNALQGNCMQVSDCYRSAGPSACVRLQSPTLVQWEICI
jgi:hypothetical protein